MRKLFHVFLFGGFCLLTPLHAQTFSPLLKDQTKASAQKSQEEEVILFTPPSGWHLADTSSFNLPHVKVMVVGKGPSHLPPSMNLSMEPYKGSLKQYLRTVKNMNAAKGDEWKDLGTIRTEAGNASLSQVDTKTQWGTMRLMQVILLKNQNIYILTASALKDEFSLFYKDFFAAMRSLRVAKDVFEAIIDQDQRKQIKAAADKVQSQWQTMLAEKQQESPDLALAEIKQNIFHSEQFQNTVWKPFTEMIDQKYNNQGPEWQSLVIQKMEDQLLNMNP